MKIYVGNLAPDTTEQDLSAAFNAYGDAFARVIVDRKSGQSRGFGYVEMPDDSDASTAIDALNGKELRGTVIVVSEAPRDLGTVKMTRRPIASVTKTKEALLFLRGGPNDGSSITISEGTTMIGRSPLNEIVLDEPGISRQHSSIRRDAEGCWITDLASHNGTFVNGESVGAEPRRLLSSDRIELGGTNTPIYWVFMEMD